MKHIYCISGLSADEKMFSKIKPDGYELHFIEWIIPEKNEAINAYAKRLIAQIHHQNIILAGLSFGGMMCIEIAKQIHVEKIIIISSIKTFHEIPFWMRLSGKLKLYKLIPVATLPVFEGIRNNNLGIETPEEKELVKYYRKKVDPRYSDWAVKNILKWKNDWIPKNLYHIHGKLDRIFSIKKIKANCIINSGGHFMILNRSAEINEYINLVLSKE